MANDRSGQKVKDEEYRLFLACPLPNDVSRALSEWAQVQFADLPLRIVPEVNLHATIMFFGSVTAEKKSRIIGLAREIAWRSLRMRTSNVDLFGRNALGIWLDGEIPDVEQLEDRLGRPQQFPSDMPPEIRYALWAFSDPIRSLTSYLAPDDLEKLQRRHRQQELLRLHITVARLQKGFLLDPSPFQAPQLAFELDKVVLYESTLAPDGAQYAVIAESCRVSRPDKLA